MADKKKLTTAPPKQVQKPQTAAPLADFNLDTKPMKYFDAKLDPRFKADTSKATSSQTHKKGVMGQALIEEDRQGGKTSIGFTKPNGLVGSKFEIYKSIEAIK